MIIVYLNFLKELQVRNLVFTAYSICIVETLMILAAFYHYNLAFGISNIHWQICIFALGKLQISLSILPMTSMIM